MDARLIVDPPASGTWNMAVDEALFQVTQESRQITLRFYQWQEATLSLGYFQAATDRDSHLPSRACPLVRRSTGGGAIIHDRELTYSLVAPLADDRSATSQQLVRIVHQSLIATLGEFGVAARFGEGSDVQNSDLAELESAKNPIASPPNLNSVRQSLSRTEPFLCFQRRAADDVFIGEHKVAGSAQRKLHRTLLQHGSVLLMRSIAAPELPGISDLTPSAISANALADAWTKHLTKALSINGFGCSLAVDWERVCHFKISAVSSDEARLARQIEVKKFASNQWNHKR